MAYETQQLKEKTEANLLKDFMRRVDEYSSLGWKNRKGLWKASVSGQVPAFAINFFSPQAIAHLKKYPDTYNSLRNVNLIFQYVKYKPKEALRRYTQRELAVAKRNTQQENIRRRARGLKPYKLPTRESLGIKDRVEKFKSTYPKIQKRKPDGEIDFIKNDWSGYLVSFASGDLKDWQSVGPDFFFKNPAIFYSTTKEKITDRIYNKVKRLLTEIQEQSESMVYSMWEELPTRKKDIERLAFSLTPQGLEKELEEKRKMEIEEETAKIDSERGREPTLELDMDEFNMELEDL